MVQQQQAAQWRIQLAQLLLQLSLLLLLQCQKGGSKRRVQAMPQLLGQQQIDQQLQQTLTCQQQQQQHVVMRR